MDTKLLKHAVGIAHSSAICRFVRAGAAGATSDGAWKDCTKVVARTCHRSQERIAVSCVALWPQRKGCHEIAGRLLVGSPLTPRCSRAGGERPERGLGRAGPASIDEDICFSS